MHTGKQSNSTADLCARTIIQYTTLVCVFLILELEESDFHQRSTNLSTHTHRHHHAASLRTRVNPLRHTPCPCPRRSLRSMPGNRIVAAAAACSLSTLGCFYFTVKQLEQGRPTLKTARNSAHQQHGQRCVCAGCESMDGVATQAARPMACTVTTLPGCPSLPNSYIPISTLILMVPAATQKKMGITVPVSVTTMLPTGTMWWLFLETCHARLRTTHSSCTIPNYLTDPSSINGRYGPLMSSLIRCTTVLDSTTVLRGMYP